MWGQWGDENSFVGVPNLQLISDIWQEIRTCKICILISRVNFPFHTKYNLNWMYKCPSELSVRFIMLHIVLYDYAPVGVILIRLHIEEKNYGESIFHYYKIVHHVLLLYKQKEGFWMHDDGSDSGTFRDAFKASLRGRLLQYCKL